MSDSGVSHIEIRRKLNFLVINIFVAKPSLVLGPNKSGLYSLRTDLSKALNSLFTSRDLILNVVEVLNPDTNARFLAEFIRQQLEKRIPFRRIIKSAVQKAQKGGVKGVKIQISGRLNGAEIARTEWVREGQVPLHTLKADIDYINYKAR